jgi:hypothetical protein
LDAERRQVTFFTSFSERSGEEAAYTLIRSLSKLMDDAVRRKRPSSLTSYTHTSRGEAERIAAEFVAFDLISLALDGSATMPSSDGSDAPGSGNEPFHRPWPKGL